MPSEYDALAWSYDRYWGTRFHDAAQPALEALLYSEVSPGDSVIDLCCGTGHLTQQLARRGYRVLGLDNSLEALRLARRRAPEARFICVDAARFALGTARWDAAVSTFDSINHLESLEQVDNAFRCTASALRPGGVFVFDVNTEEAYRSEWGKSSAVVDADAALFVRGGYDPTAGVGHTTITVFRFEDEWRRTDVHLTQRAYTVDDLTSGLTGAGFGAIEVVSATQAGMVGDIAVGRLFVRARLGR